MQIKMRMGRQAVAELYSKKNAGGSRVGHWPIRMWHTKVHRKHSQKIFCPHAALMYLLLSWYVSNQDTVSFLSVAIIGLPTFHSILTWILKRLQFYSVASFSLQFKKKITEVQTNTAESEKHSEV